MNDMNDEIPNHILNLYNMCYREAEREVYSSNTMLLLTELFFTNEYSYDACCSDIACNIIGG